MQNCLECAFSLAGCTLEERQSKMSATSVDKMVSTWTSPLRVFSNVLIRLNCDSGNLKSSITKTVDLKWNVWNDQMCFENEWGNGNKTLGTRERTGSFTGVCVGVGKHFCIAGMVRDQYTLEHTVACLVALFWWFHCKLCDSDSAEGLPFLSQVQAGMSEECGEILLWQQPTWRKDLQVSYTLTLAINYTSSFVYSFIVKMNLYSTVSCKASQLRSMH